MMSVQSYKGQVLYRHHSERLYSAPLLRFSIHAGQNAICSCCGLELSQLTKKTTPTAVAKQKPNNGGQRKVTHKFERERKREGGVETH